MFNSHIPTEIHLNFSLCDFCKIINRRTTITFGSLTDKLLRIITFWGNVSILALALAAQDAHRPPACVRNHSFSRCSACQIFLSADFSHFFILSIWFSMHCFYVSPQNQLSFGDKLGWSWVFQLQRRDSSQTDSHADERREERERKRKRQQCCDVSTSHIGDGFHYYSNTSMWGATTPNKPLNLKWDGRK